MWCHVIPLSVFLLFGLVWCKVYDMICLSDSSNVQSSCWLSELWQVLLSGTFRVSNNLIINLCTTSSLLRSITSGEGAGLICRRFTCFEPLLVFALPWLQSFSLETPTGTEPRLETFLWLLDILLFPAAASSTAILLITEELFTSLAFGTLGSELTRGLCLDEVLDTEPREDGWGWLISSSSLMHGSEILDLSFRSVLCALSCEAIWYLSCNSRILSSQYHLTTKKEINHVCYGLNLFRNNAQILFLHVSAMINWTNNNDPQIPFSDITIATKAINYFLDLGCCSFLSHSQDSNHKNKSQFIIRGQSGLKFY